MGGAVECAGAAATGECGGRAELPEIAAWQAAGAPPACVRAVTEAVVGATRASGEHRHDAAAQGYDAALRALGAGAPSAPRLAVTLRTAHAETVSRAGRQMEAREVAETALAEARSLGDPELLARAAIGYAGRLQGFGAAICDQRVVSVLRDALDALPPGDGPLRALVMARLAEELAVTPSDSRLVLGRRAVRMARRLEDPRSSRRCSTPRTGPSGSRRRWMIGGSWQRR